jgi:hypothetical protein
MKQSVALIFISFILEKLSVRQRLVKNLFDEYDPYLMPVLNLKKAKSVTLDFTLSSIKIVILFHSFLTKPCIYNFKQFQNEAKSSSTSCGILAMVFFPKLLLQLLIFLFEDLVR